MSREIRRVPANWNHPKNERGYHRPLFDGFTRHAQEWNEANAKWAEGLQRDYSNDGWKPIEGEYKGKPFEEYDGARPDPNDYMPEWTEEERTHIQMYETCSEGTPISPVMDDPKKLAHWLADNGASAMGYSTATYEQWFAMIGEGWCPSMVSSPQTGLVSGVEGIAALKS